MVDDAVAAVAALLWLTTAIQAATMLRRRHPEPARTMLLLAFALLAVSATFFTPTVHAATGHVTGIANLAEPIARTALLGAAWAVQVMLQRLGDHGTTGTRIGRRAAALIVFVAALWACFLAAQVDNPTDMFTSDYGDAPLVAAYLLVSLTYLALALVDVIRGTLRYGRDADGILARALRLIGIGCWLGLGYVAVKVVFVVLLLSGHGAAGSTLESNTARLLAVGGGLLVVVGSTLPFLAARTTRARAWLTTYRNLRRLYPLWALMYTAEPGIALDPPRSALADALQLRDLDMRLYRRIIEIHDGRLALAPYLDPAPDLGDEASDAAAAEAAALRAAVQRQRLNNPGPTTAPAHSATENGTIDDEVQWFLRVAHHLPRTDVTVRHAPLENPPTTPSPRTTA
ncbi:MAG: hypothetical protein JNL54_21950 [Kineosporiaceae bacterium]|nr:hypothetical protein [Kineosporiaceae bacterium]